MNSSDSQDDAASDDRLGRIIATYLDSERAGKPPDRHELLRQHRDLADDLKQFFVDHDRIRALAEPEETVEVPRTHDDAAAGPPMPPMADRDEPSTAGLPRRFGDYELLEEIDRGGMGVVYKARQVSLDRIVALKMILAGQLASREDVRRFHREAEAAANLDHPGIVPIHEVGQHEGCHYYAMGLVEGPSLAARLADGPMPARQAAEITRQIAEAVAYAHTHGVIHRDLKPANILLSLTSARDDRPDGGGSRSGVHDWPKITDFGLAKRAGGEGGLTTAGQILGTPSYMPPEQALGRTEQVSERADIYSIGAILYALLTGRPPFHADSPLDVLVQVIEQDAKAPRELRRGVPRDLNTICLKCLAKQPESRYRSADDLADDLGRFLQDEPIQARPLGPVGRILRWARSHPALAMTWTGLGAYYVIHLICLWVLGRPGEGGTFHWAITGLLCLWAAGAWTFQRLALRTGWDLAVLYGWTAMDVILFTCALTAADGPSSPLVMGYLLLIAGAGLRFRIRLVWFVTVLSSLGYLWLVLDARWYRPALQVPLYVGIYFLLSLVVMALIMHLVLRRIRTMTRMSGLPGPA